MEYQIIFFKNTRGKIPILDYLNSLQENIAKLDCNVRLKRFCYCLDLLKYGGLNFKEPVAKTSDGDIWALHPSHDRVLLVSSFNNNFLLLSYTIRKTTDDLKNEIARAKKNLKEFISYEHE